MQFSILPPDVLFEILKYLTSKGRAEICSVSWQFHDAAIYASKLLSKYPELYIIQNKQQKAQLIESRPGPIISPFAPESTLREIVKSGDYHLFVRLKRDVRNIEKYAAYSGCDDLVKYAVMTRCCSWSSLLKGAAAGDNCTLIETLLDLNVTYVPPEFETYKMFGRSIINSDRCGAMCTAMRIAAKKNRVKSYKILFERYYCGTCIIVGSSDIDRHFVIAYRYGHMEMIKLITELCSRLPKVKPTLAGNQNVAYESGNMQIIKYMVDTESPYVESLSSPNIGSTCFYSALRSGNMELIKSLEHLLAPPCYYNPLWNAVSSHNKEVVRYLLDLVDSHASYDIHVTYDARLHISQQDILTSLRHACVHGLEEIYAMIMERYPNTTLELLPTLFAGCTHNGHMNMIKIICNNSEEKFDAPQSLVSAMSSWDNFVKIRSIFGHLDIFRYLAEKYQWNRDNMFRLACIGGNADVIRYTMSLYYSRGPNLISGFVGACMNGSVQLVQWFIDQIEIRGYKVSKETLYRFGLKHAIICDNVLLVQKFLKLGAVITPGMIQKFAYRNKSALMFHVLLEHINSKWMLEFCAKIGRRYYLTYMTILTNRKMGTLNEQ
jgi:hypothetical protein